MIVFYIASLSGTSKTTEVLELPSFYPLIFADTFELRGKGRAVFLIAFGGQLAVHALYDVLSDRKSQTVALCGARFFGTVKAVENVLQIALGYHIAAVIYSQNRGVRVFAQRYGDRAVICGILNGIIYQNMRKLL